MPRIFIYISILFLFFIFNMLKIGVRLHRRYCRIILKMFLCGSNSSYCKLSDCIKKVSDSDLVA